MSDKQLATQSAIMPSPIRISNDEALNKVLSMWNDPKKLEEIRKIYAPKLSDGEFKAFVEMGIATCLNPFLREIWAVKYDQSAPAQIFIGRDGYRKIISRNEGFEGLIVESVCANDEFNVDIVKGEVKHIPNIKDRGKLIGGYCIIYMRGMRIPYYVFVPIEEYDTGRSVWKDKKHTMIKKVAECQCIRMADQTCASTYSPDEMPEDRLKDQNSKADQLNKGFKLYEGETVDTDTGEIKQISSETNSENVTSSEPVILEAPKNECPFTYDELKNNMGAAATVQELNDFAAVISQMNVTTEERSALAKVYRDRMKELKKLEMDGQA
ncbi:MAG TPA: RecT family recombinase [Hanamia sp.]|jgi:RecT family.|nr:RecT family recombinase [Hanamia sp.]